MKLPIISSTLFTASPLSYLRMSVTHKIGLCSYLPHYRTSFCFYPCVLHCVLHTYHNVSMEIRVQCCSLPFPLFETVPCTVHCGLHQASWLVNFQGSSCLYLLPRHWALGLRTCTRVFRCVWFCGSNLRPSCVRSDHCICWFISLVLGFILIHFFLCFSLHNFYHMLQLYQSFLLYLTCQYFYPQLQLLTSTTLNRDFKKPILCQELLKDRCLLDYFQVQF